MDTRRSDSGTSRSVQVRLAKPDDAAMITTVINLAFRQVESFFVSEDRVDVESVRNYLSSGLFLLAKSEGTILGCVYVEPPLRNSDLSPALPGAHAYLGLLAVDPAHQQSGLGSVLMDAAEDYCSGAGAAFVDIKVVSLREELFGFYRRRGYVETGTSPFPADVETKLPCHFIDMSKVLNESKKKALNESKE